jgi:hypothetical protein
MGPGYPGSAREFEIRIGSTGSFLSCANPDTMSFWELASGGGQRGRHWLLSERQVATKIIQRLCQSSTVTRVKVRVSWAENSWQIIT